ncbi:MAG: hypothetical protein JWO31_1728, partial [Phycisphaerales bacterium]|nr:hypothetical protein [Phycisphaerales bacterium]
MVSVPTAATGARDAAGRLRAAVAGVALLGAVAALQTGCDSPASVANKALRSKVIEAGDKPGVTAKDASVAEAVGRELGGTTPPAVADALAALGAYDPAQPDSVTDWGQKSKALTIGKKDAIARAMRSAGVEDRKAVIAKLEEAAKVEGSSPAARVDPLNRLSTARAAVADAIARDAADKEIESARQVDPALRLLAQIGLNTVRANSFKGQDPKATTDALAALKAKVAGTDATSVWAGEGEAALPAGTAIDAAAAKAQSDLDGLTAKKKESTDKATKFRQEVARLTEESKKQTGELAYASAVEAAKQAQQATAIDIEVQGLDRQILDAQGRLQIAQARKPVVEEAVKSFELRSQQAQDRWKTAQDLATQTTDASRKILNGDGTGGSTGGGKSKEEPTLTAPGATRPAAGVKYTEKDLAKISRDHYVVARVERATTAANEAEELRKQAADQYQAALADLAQAKDAAKAAVRDLQDRKPAGPSAELTAVQAQIDLLDESQFAYADAEIHQRLARLQGDRAIGTAVRADLRAQAAATLKAAGIDPMPGPIDALPQQKDLDAEVKKADEAFAAAEAALDPFFKSDGGADATGPLFAENLKTTRGQYSQAAGALLVNGQYARSRVLALGGDKSAGDKLTAAVSAARQYQQRYESALPAAAPAEVLAKLGVAPVALPSATRPTTAPAAAPAGA